MIKNILWDFDGVILDSLAVRDYGFREIFKNFEKEDVEKLIAYHQQNGGLSRFHKIKYFFEEIIHQPIDDNGIECCAREFSEIMRRELSNPQYLIQETMTFISSHYQQIRFFIASGSENNELNFLCHKLGIAQYFSAIYGSPTPKVDLVAKILFSHDCDPRECILIGDSINDYDAAKTHEVAFYGYNNASLQGISERYIKTFRDIPLY